MKLPQSIALRLRCSIWNSEPIRYRITAVMKAVGWLIYGLTEEEIRIVESGMKS